uniref:RING-type E3 ubiquitin transferase n=1 Tax=Cacopsylla melanoneura TaxID=428564 RepID=A0A8D8R8Y3_9HEMI
MGAFSSRQNSREEEVDTSSNISYRYPPKSGNYFGSHFIMGGEKFDTPQPEAYLFGENTDLNFLGNKPTPFPYPPPQSNEPYKTLKALVNIRKESLRFVKVSNDSPQQAYNIEFIFDCDVPCSITIHFFATEDTTNNTVSYIPKNPSCAPPSKSFHYKKGASQLFSQPSVTFTPSHYDDEELVYNMDREVIPIAIHCVTVSEDGQEDSKQSHTSIAVVDHHADGCYTLKGLKQKLYVDGLCYLLQEIYGIENKNNDTYKGCEDCEDGGSECVICMCDIRDTLILPCRHLCLCYSCADSLRYQANNCPICRAPFRALLQIRALQKNSGLVSEASSDNIPSGYDAISLIEALNGPCAVRHPPMVVSLDPLAENPDHQTAGQLLNRRASGERGGKKSGGDEKGGVASEVNGAAPEIRMSALLASSQDLSPTSTSDLSTSEHPPPPHPPLLPLSSQTLSPV